MHWGAPVKSIVIRMWLCVLSFIPALAWQAPLESEAPGNLPAATTQEQAQEVQLRRSMSVIPSLEQVTIAIRGQSVILTGEVPNEADRRLAAELVTATLPQAFLLNQLAVPGQDGVSDTPPAAISKVDKDIQERLAQIFSSIPTLADVRVQVQHGVVQLSGQAITVEASEKAADLAGKISHVVFVDNGIQVTQEVNRRLTPVIENTVSQLRHIWLSLPLVIIALIILGIFFLIGKWAMRWERLYKMVDAQPLVKGILQQAVFLVFLLIGLILALDLLNARRLVTTLFGAAGIVGLALGFALKDIVENYLASLLLAIRRPFTADDFVQIGSYEGKVIRLNMRDTVLMTPSGNHLRLPNALVFKSVIENFTRNPMRRFKFDVGIGCNEDLTRVKEICLNTLEGIKGLSQDSKPFFTINSLGDSTVIVSLFGWVNQAEYSLFKVKSESIRLVKEALDQANIAMPAPTYVVDMQQQAEDDGGKAQSQESNRRVEADLKPEHDLDKQIAKDRADGETNLL